MALLEMKGITKLFYGIPANDHIDLSVEESEIHALLGENGAGKTTLMNILYGLYHCDEGEIWWNGVKQDFQKPLDAIACGIGMVHQHFMLVEAMTVFDNIILGDKHAKGVFIDRAARRKEIEALSEKYGLDVQLDKLITEISVGEQQRTEILKALYHGAELLILDEPTNDLDLATLNILEDYLDSFQGAIIAVSHDRYFLDRITTHLFAVEDAHMVPYIGGYQSYLDAQEAKAEAMADMKQPAAAKPKDTRVRVQTQLKFSYKEQRDFDTIENRVAELEEKLAQLEQEIAANASDYTKVTELMDTQAKTQQELDEATERWLFLQEKWEQIQAQKG